ncbi:hypothetical protein ACFVY9_00565 [Streptomyces sp. NPDC059544]|uniref:hypothetical protein n=1 Tax=Streptomyces sp. NPDC059544 TaxID=3346861 RepID=UPI00368063A0
MADRIVTCRYLKAYNTQCTAEAIDPDGEVLLCIRHYAAAVRTVEAAQRRAVKSARPKAD